MKGLFKLSTLAVSVLAASQVSAIELYNAEGTTVNMSGAIAAHVSSYDYDESTIIGNPVGLDYNSDAIHIEDPGSFFGFDIQHKFGPWAAVAKLEWDVNFGTKTDINADFTEQEALSDRQTYAGFGHEDFGTVTIGRQESPYMKTDKGYYAYWVGGLNMMQSDELGSRRSPNTIVWQHDFDNLYVGLQYQAKRSVDNIKFGNGLSFGSFLVGGSLDTNTFELNYGPAIQIDDGFGGAVTYTIEQTGTYLAAAYNQANGINGSLYDYLAEGDFGMTKSGNITATDAEIKQYAIAIEQHLLEGGLSLAARFEHFEAKDGNGAFDSKTNNFGLGANLYVTESARIYGGYEMAKEEAADGTTTSEASMFNIGAAWAPVPWGEVYLESYTDDIKLNQAANYETGEIGVESKGTHFFLGAAVFF
ncbi:porin [Vibrio hangzhouensis]|uniref:porin n=1 Tax=Vibrio hangzhouensis TaxID=462991 RepID=UPI001C96F9CA|nr:porin [Vibrio hangzhouensis]MBY6196296.1 porin [Vibrio hangzhouensis]